MLPAAAVRRAVPVLLQHGHVDQGILVAWMLRSGVPKEYALNVTRFVPLAFGRELLGGMGVALSDTYVRMSADGKETLEVPLANEEVFTEAVRLANLIAFRRCRLLRR